MPLLCSKCREEIKPVVALDIDGTMGDFHSHFLKFATGYLLGKPVLSPPIEAYDGSNPMSEWFCNFFGVSYQTWSDIKLAYRQGGMKRTMPSYGWGRKVSTACQAAGAEVWVTTTRPYLRLDNIDPDTRFWLENEGVKYDGLLYDEDKYNLLSSLVGSERVVAVVEDLPDEWNNAAVEFGYEVPILYRANHNRCFWDKIPRDQIVHEGETAWRACQDRIANWFEANVPT